MTPRNTAQPHPGFSNTQRPSGMPVHRYRPFPPIDLPDRTWPQRQITAPQTVEICGVREVLHEERGAHDGEGHA